MAKLKELIGGFSHALDDMPVLAIDPYVRPLRTAGMLTTGGRGTGAPDVTPADAARLLLAILGGSPNRAFQTVEAISECRRVNEYWAAGSPRAVADDRLIEALGIDHNHSIIDIIPRLISHDYLTVCKYVFSTWEISQGLIIDEVVPYWVDFEIDVSRYSASLWFGRTASATDFEHSRILMDEQQIGFRYLHPTIRSDAPAITRKAAVGHYVFEDLRKVLSG